MKNRTYRLLLCNAGFHSWTAWRRRKGDPHVIAMQYSRCRRCGKERAREATTMPRVMTTGALVSLAISDKQDAEQSALRG